MIAKTYINTNLSRLDVLFRESSSPTKELFYSKLAIIELCGWIEITMDDIVDRCASRNIADAANIKAIEAIIKKNYGFDYELNFKKMLVQIIGLKNVERIERKVDPVKFQVLKTQLSNLKISRNSLAHTYLKGTAFTLDAPSATKARFPPLFDGLIAFEKTMIKLRC